MAPRTRGRTDIDAVLVATGDHWHALAAAADRYARVFQAGTQRRSLANFQYAYSSYILWS